MILAEHSVPPEFEVFRRRASRLTGLDLTSYRAPQMHRRLCSLINTLGIANFAEYARVLETDAARRHEFRDYLTINVSEFFRDADRFADLERRVLPYLLSGGSGLRVWSAGCSIGAEAYSLAILLHESAPRRAHSILATDVDQASLDRASAGSGYLAQDVRNVGAERMRRYFTGGPAARAAINPVPKELIRFVLHDLLSDAYPNGPFDLIACRNVVIYFTAEAKERVFQQFVHALRPGGVLFLGGTEAIMRPQQQRLSLMGPGFYCKDV